MYAQIFAGAGLGLFLALAIGAAYVLTSFTAYTVSIWLNHRFIAVWFTQASDLWAKSELLWEGLCVFLARNSAHPEPRHL
jgi:high-affinity iron transporter